MTKIEPKKSILCCNQENIQIKTNKTKKWKWKPKQPRNDKMVTLMPKDHFFKDRKKFEGISKKLS
jgi:hypothetical protein